MRRALIALASLVIVEMGHSQQVNAPSQGASASSQTEPRSYTPGCEVASCIGLSIDHSLKRIAASLEAQATGGKAADDKQREKEDLEAQKSMAFWAMLMFFAAAFGTFASGIAAWLVYKTLRETRAATLVSTRSADATERAAQVARESSEKQLRAYITVHEAAAYWKPKEPDDVTIKVVRVRLVLRNTGQTPATAFLARVYTADMPPASATFPEPAIPDSVGVVGPAQANSCDFETQVENMSGVVRAWKANERAFFVWGEIRYIDAFKTQRWTKFRYIMAREGISDGEGKLRPCAEGNELQ